MTIVEVQYAQANETIDQLTVLIREEERRLSQLRESLSRTGLDTESGRRRAADLVEQIVAKEQTLASLRRLLANELRRVERLRRQMEPI